MWSKYLVMIAAGLGGMSTTVVARASDGDMTVDVPPGWVATPNDRVDDRVVGFEIMTRDDEAGCFVDFTKDQKHAGKSREQIDSEAASDANIDTRRKAIMGKYASADVRAFRGKYAVGTEIIATLMSDKSPTILVAYDTPDGNTAIVCTAPTMNVFERLRPAFEDVARSVRSPRFGH